jgi:DNA polymerase-3 subunit delta'
MAARELAARSGGSLSRARELADAELWALRDRFGAAWSGAQFDVQGVAHEFEDFVNSAGKAAEARRGRLRQLIAVVGELFRQSLRSAADRAESIDAILAGLQRCLEAEEQLDRNANQATLIECWLSDLAGIHQTWTAGPLAASRR